MESLIDERYRLKLLEYYLEDAYQLPYKGNNKWVFRCPFCAHYGKTEAKRKHKKGSLIWHPEQHSWVFSCARKGSPECFKGKTLGNLISALNPALGEAYKRERWHSGSAGKGHNCGLPQGLR